MIVKNEFKKINPMNLNTSDACSKTVEYKQDPMGCSKHGNTTRI